jgi:hypothetical protein
MARLATSPRFAAVMAEISWINAAASDAKACSPLIMESSFRPRQESVGWAERIETDLIVPRKGFRLPARSDLSGGCRVRAQRSHARNSDGAAIPYGGCSQNCARTGARAPMTLRAARLVVREARLHER